MIYKLLIFILFLITTTLSYAQPGNYSWIAEFDDNFGNTRLFSDGAASSGIRSLEVQATSASTEYLIEWDSFNNKWQNTSTPIDQKFTLFHGDSNSPNGVLNTTTTNGNYYTFQIDGLAYSDRDAVVMETTNQPVDFSTSTPLTPTSPTVYPGQDLDITVNFAAGKSAEEKIFIRYSTDSFSTSDVVVASFSSNTGSSGTATIPGSVNSSGTSVDYYAYSTTVSATVSSNHDLITLKIANNGGSNYSYTVENSWTTTSDGIWSESSTWTTGNVPSAGDAIDLNHDVTLDVDAEVSDITISSGKTLTSDDNQGKTLTIQNGGNFTNDGTFTANDGNVIFQGNNVISSSSGTTFNNVTLNNGGVDFSTNSTINNNLTINSGGFVDTNSPIYGNNSTLIYNSANPTGTPYERRSEWSNAGSQGSPNNVVLQNNTALNMGFDNTIDDAIIDGDLTIESGSSLFMDFGSNDMEAPLIVRGDFINNGTISLSNFPGGDLKLEGDLTDNGTFNYNNRALFFEGSNVQEISTSANPYTIDVLRLDKSSGEVTMNQDIIIDETSDPLQMSQQSILNLNGHDLTIGKNGVPSQVSFMDDAALKVSDQSDLILKGNGNMGDLQFDDSNDRTTNKIRYVDVDRGSGDVSLGNQLYLKDSINLTSGTLNANGNLTFVSNSSETAQVGEIPASGGSISGNVIVERFVPKSNRAFRYISSPVNTSGTINDNLQEGVNNPDQSTNLNPNPGFGTHITGDTDGNNGFDATSTGNHSMFEWDEGNQEWDEIPSTNQPGDEMSVGDAYALMVRGDRSTTLNSNTAVGPETTLRFTGTLVGGNQAVAGTNLSSTSGNYNLVANPYQAIVDMKTLMESADATDLDDQTIYVYDPTLGTQGGYAAIDLSMGTPTATPDADSLSTFTTNANQFILPNQAFFVETTGNNPALTFKETYKNTAANFVDTFSDDDVLSEMHINLKRQPEDVVVDGVTARFDPNHTNAVNNADADEVWNFDEWVALFNSDTYLSIEKRATPVENDTLQIYTGNYQSDAYVWNVDISNINREAVLVDTYLDTETPLNANDETSIAFTIDSNIPESTDPFRFSIRFTNETLAIDEAEKKDFAVYPNPVTNNQFNISGLQIGSSASILLFDMTGKLVFNTTRSAGNTTAIVIDQSLPTGVYQLQIIQDQTQYQSTLIISE